MSDHHRRLERMFQASPLNQGAFKGSKLTVGESKATYELVIGEQYFHAADAMHGAIYFKLLDDSAYFAAASQETTHFMLTKSYQIHFTRPVEADLLKAEGHVVSQDEKEIIAKSVIYNSNGKVVAHGEGIFVKGPKELKGLPGYSD